MTQAQHTSNGARERIRLPEHFGTIFQKLTSGYHFCIDDGELYQSLKSNYSDFKHLLDEIGYSLSDGSDGIYYIIPRDNSEISPISRKFTAFVTIMFDWLANQGKSPAHSIFSQTFEVPDLPHLDPKMKQYISIMEQLEIYFKDDLDRLINQLRNYGFLTITGPERSIRFKPSVRRFIDLFEQLARNEDADTGQQDTKGEGE